MFLLRDLDVSSRAQAPAAGRRPVEGPAVPCAPRKIALLPDLVSSRTIPAQRGSAGTARPSSDLCPFRGGTLSCRLRGGHSLCIKAPASAVPIGTNRAAASLTTNVTPRWFKICPEMCDGNHLLSCVIALLLNCDVETCAMCGCLWLHTSAWPPGKYRYTVKTV